MKKRMYQLSIDDCKTACIEPDTSRIAAWLEAEDIGNSITITVVEIDKKEFDALPEIE